MESTGPQLTPSIPSSTPSSKLVSFFIIIVGFFSLVFVIWYVYSPAGPFGQARKRDEANTKTLHEILPSLDEKKESNTCMLDVVKKVNEYAVANPQSTQVELSELSAKLQTQCDQTSTVRSLDTKQ